MWRLNNYCVLLFSMLLAGCASTPNYPPPPLAKSVIVSDSPYAIDKTNANPVRIGNSAVFLFQNKGGSVGLALLGALTGGLGTALAGSVNAQLVANQSANMASRLSGTGLDNLTKSIKDKIADRMGELSHGKALFVIAGSILLNVDGESQVRASLIINARDSSSQDGWSKSYFYHFMPIKSVQELEDEGFQRYLDRIALDLDYAMDSTSRVLLDDLSGKYVSGTPVKIKSEFLSVFGTVVMPFHGLKIEEQGGRFVFRIDGKPGVVIFPTVDGVHLFREGQFSTAL